MHTTPPSLLERLRDPAAARADWDRFVAIYTPLLFEWAGRFGLQPDAAADAVQDTFVLLTQRLKAFRYDPRKKFRHWLWTVLLNTVRKEAGRRREVAVGGDADWTAAVPDDADPIGEVVEADYRRHLVRHALRVMEAEFRPNTWRACWLNVVDGRPAADVGAELGMTANAVRVARCHVLRRLREELAGLLD